MSRHNIKFSYLSILICALGLTACNKQPESSQQGGQDHVVQQSSQKINNEILPYLNIEPVVLTDQHASCLKKACENIDIQSIKTTDTWLNQQVEQSLAGILQDQINAESTFKLNDAITAYVKHSNQWAKEFALNKPYHLDLATKVSYQRNQFVLIQFVVNSKQAEVVVKDRAYFLVLDRKLKQKLNIADVIAPNQLNDFDRIIQQAYRQWLKTQVKDVQALAPTKMDWKKMEWFFDGEGIGIHIRANEFIKGSGQFDTFLTKAQTQQVMQKNIFEKMF